MLHLYAYKFGFCHVLSIVSQIILLRKPFSLWPKTALARVQAFDICGMIRDRFIIYFPSFVPACDLLRYSRDFLRSRSAKIMTKKERESQKTRLRCFALIYTLRLHWKMKNESIEKFQSA